MIYVRAYQAAKLQPLLLSLSLRRFPSHYLPLNCPGLRSCDINRPAHRPAARFRKDYSLKVLYCTDLVVRSAKRASRNIRL